jgi:hypothetical protein
LADHVAAAGGARLDGARLLTERAALGGRGRQGRLSVGGSCRLLPTRNGWATVSDARPDDPLLWSALIGRDLEPGALPGRLADWLAAHDGAELDERVELLSLAGGTVRPRTDHACPLPAEPRGAAGLLVVDFSALWAGPLFAHLLGTAGARVVKVETPSRPDGARFGDPAFYDLLHAGHASVVLDPTDAHGRAALHELVGRADVVVEASRPRALAGFGLDAEAEAARGCIWISITAYGRASGRVGFGDDVAAARGLLGTDADGLPVFAGDAVADPLTGLLAAALALSERSGGAVLDVAMADVVSASLAVPDGRDTRLVGQGRLARGQRRRVLPGGRPASTPAGRHRLCERRRHRHGAARPGDPTAMSGLLIRDAEVDSRRCSVRVRDGRVEELGPGLARTPGEAEVRAAGGALLPGLTDHHLHLFALASAFSSVRCAPPDVRAPTTLQAALHHAAPDRYGWVRGIGYDERVAGSLDAARLDALRADVPVRAQHRSGALWVLNSRAAERVGLAHGRHPGIERDPTGRPTGRVWRADEWLRERLPEAAAPSLAAVGRRLARHGITAVTDATPRLTERSVDALATEARSGRLSQRLRLLGAPLGTPTGRTADAWPLEDRPRGLRAAGLSAVDRRDRRRTPARPSGVRAHCHGRLARPAACSTGADRRAPR